MADVSTVWTEEVEPITGTIRHVGLIGIHSAKNRYERHGRTVLRYEHKRVLILDMRDLPVDEFGDAVTHRFHLHSIGLAKPAQFRDLAAAKKYAEALHVLSWRQVAEWSK